jgi:hypothetical protein
MTDQHPNYQKELEDAVCEAAPKIVAGGIMAAAAVAVIVAIATGDEPELSTLEELMEAYRQDTGECLNFDLGYEGARDLSLDIAAHVEHDPNHPHYVEDLFIPELADYYRELGVASDAPIVNWPVAYDVLQEWRVDGNAQQQTFAERALAIGDGDLLLQCDARADTNFDME